VRRGKLLTPTATLRFWEKDSSKSASLLQYDEYWLSAANEGDVFWDEGEAGDYFNELFTDCYLSEPDLSVPNSDQPLSLPVTRNVVVMITVVWGSTRVGN